MGEEALLQRAVRTPKHGLRFALKQVGTGKPVLILCPHSSVADDYLRYQPTTCFDCKRACLEVALWKRKSIADVRAEVRSALRTALSGKQEQDGKEGYTNLAGTLMQPNLYARPLWLPFGTSAFHLTGLVHDQHGLPLRALTGSFSHEDGVACGLLTPGEAARVDRAGFPFQVILTSQLSPADAARYLAPAVPGFEDLSVIYVEPDEDDDDDGGDADAGRGAVRAGAAAHRESRVHRALPAEALARVEAAILSRDDAELQAAIAAAKEHWAERGRYLSREEVGASSREESGAAQPQGRAPASGDVQAPAAASSGTVREPASASAYAGLHAHERQKVLQGRLAQLQEDFAAADNTTAVEVEAWTLLEVEDWVEIDGIWLELVSSADSQEWEQL